MLGFPWYCKTLSFHLATGRIVEHEREWFNFIIIRPVFFPSVIGKCQILKGNYFTLRLSAGVHFTVVCVQIWPQFTTILSHYHGFYNTYQPIWVILLLPPLKNPGYATVKPPYLGKGPGAAAVGTRSMWHGYWVHGTVNVACCSGKAKHVAGGGNSM